MDISIDDIMVLLKDYSDRDKKKIKKAYEYAALAHNGQYRCSGEPYITHPLHVAKIVAELIPDADTICAALLHDTIEDCNVTYEDLKHEFGETVANLVDGVTKMSAFKFLTKKEQDLKYTRKVIIGSTKDIRTIIIKIPDKLHNMSTMRYKPKDRQVANAFEALHIFAPMANSIGAYLWKNELEDLSFQILEPDIYKDLSDRRSLFYEQNAALIAEVSDKIKRLLESNDVPCEIKSRVKSIYSIYKKINEGNDFASIQDLLSIKIIVDELLDCYSSVHYVHREYNPLGNTFKDYIAHPKVNKYRALHSTVMVKDNVPFQMQIKTPNMDSVDDLGLCAYWGIYGHNGYHKMQKDLDKDFPLYSKIKRFDAQYENDEEFIYHLEAELSPYKTFVYNSSGEIIELPYGSNVENYLSVGGINVDDVDYCTVNGKRVSLKQLLKNDDLVFVKKKDQRLVLLQK